MTLPSLVLGIICALLIGSLFHVVVDGGPARLLLYLLLSTVGFGMGHWIGSLQNWMFFTLGPLRLGSAICGSLLFLIVGHWLSKVTVEAADPGDTV